MNTVSLTILKKGNKYFFQHRDNKPGIASPGLFAGFGGALETGEIPLQAARRELSEETSLDIDKMKFKELGIIDLTDQGLGIRYTYIADITDSDFEVFEGQGKVQLSKDEITSLGADKFATSTWEALKLVI
jgi:8-oxo-dGTP diphosphatase